MPRRLTNFGKYDGRILIPLEESESEILKRIDFRKNDIFCFQPFNQFVSTFFVLVFPLIYTGILGPLGQDGEGTRS